MTNATAELQSHAAALGVRFYTATNFPAQYQGAAFIAEHGSWDTQPPHGYKVSVVQFDSTGHAVSYEPFMTGWIDNAKTCVTDDDCVAPAFCQNATRSDGGEIYSPPYYCAGWGRPSDVAVHPGTGGLLVSDERSGVVYLVRYESVPLYRQLGFLIAVPLALGCIALGLAVFFIGRCVARQRSYTELSF